MTGEVLTAPPVFSEEHEEVEDTPRTLVTRHGGQDRLFIHGSRAIAFLVLLIVGSIGVFLGAQSVPTLQTYGLGFFTEFRWLPSQDRIGIAAVVVGTIEVALIAIS